MRADEAFLDTNVLLYLFSSDAKKADRAEQLLMSGGVISIQVLNEFTAVALRKLHLTWPEIEEATAAIRAACRTVPLTTETYDLGIALAKRYRFSLYDAMIAASACLQECEVLYSQDMQHDRRIDGKLTIRNPFA